mmetsp:Transcript_12620/g.28647  ORF Transcript_12620/g.28647 Transcript_12620/m.28647 type:complete len:238 (-) Transcript_12620:656-1369(-)
MAHLPDRKCCCIAHSHMWVFEQLQQDLQHLVDCGINIHILNAGTNGHGCSDPAFPRGPSRMLLDQRAQRVTGRCKAQLLDKEIHASLSGLSKAGVFIVFLRIFIMAFPLIIMCNLQHEAEGERQGLGWKVWNCFQEHLGLVGCHSNDPLECHIAHAIMQGVAGLCKGKHHLHPSCIAGAEEGCLIFCAVNELLQDLLKRCGVRHGQGFQSFLGQWQHLLQRLPSGATQRSRHVSHQS